MANPNTSAIPGIYSAANNILVSANALTVTGSWSEVTAGGRYFLTTTGGAAAAEILEGKGTCTYGGSAELKSFSTANMGLNNNSTPAIGWVFSVSRLTFYKVIAVLTNDKIEVEALHGSAPGAIVGCNTGGSGIKSLTVTGTAGTVSIYGYNLNGTNAPIVVASGATAQIPINLTISGPVYFTGTGTVSLNA